MKSPTAPLSIGSRVGLAIGSLLIAVVIALPPEAAQSRGSDRTLKLYFGHTGERGTFIFKRNGRYDRKELERINTFLRDWRKDEPTRMDPQLLDLLWEIYRESGSDDYIHVVSAYRSPGTNAMLRKRSSGVAKNSQHMRGKAVDFAIPDVPLDKLRAIAMKKQGGGVGYYPRSGFPFVHVDTGSVRAWPRMSRQQLLALFPNGETLHLPPDGKPLPGYERAVARRQTSGATTLAYLETEEPEDADRTGTGEGGGVRAWLKRVFPGDGEPAADGGEEATEAGAPVELAATADDDGLEPRRPRPRPPSELALAAAEPGAPAPATVAPEDSRMIATLAFAPLPRTRPDPVFLAASLGAPDAAEPLPVAGSLRARLPEEPSTDAAAADPVELAFAALENAAPSPNENDRAVIAAFAAMRAGSAPPPAATATAATPAEPRRLAVASAAAAAPPPPAADAAADAAAGGIVLAPDALPRYDADRNAIRGLIASPATYDPQFARLAMPAPAGSASVYRVPEAAGEVAQLAGQPGLPVDRFATAESAAPAPAERGFFMRLFASLIE